MRILSLGCGVNSTALLILKDFDLAVFCDTGGENPETYEYLEKYIKPYCKKHNIRLEEIRREDTLYDHYMSKQIIPTRRFRHCTDKFKIRPLKKFFKQFDTVEVLIGFASDEAHRAKDGCGNTYPLIEMGITREGCKQIIIDAGLPIPIKSGCYFCPFTPKQKWLDLLENHKDLFIKAEKLEKNNKRYPRLTLTNKTLESVRKSKEDQQGLCDYLESCEFCEISTH